MESKRLEKKVAYKDGFVFKTYFKLRIGNGEDSGAFTMDLKKRSYTHPDYEKEVLIIYSGDKGAVNENYYNGNAQSRLQMETPFYPTVPSALITAKERMKET